MKTPVFIILLILESTYQERTIYTLKSGYKKKKQKLEPVASFSTFSDQNIVVSTVHNQGFTLQLKDNDSMLSFSNIKLSISIQMRQ